MVGASWGKVTGQFRQTRFGEWFSRLIIRLSCSDFSCKTSCLTATTTGERCGRSRRIASLRVQLFTKRLGRTCLVGCPPCGSFGPNADSVWSFAGPTDSGRISRRTSFAFVSPQHKGFLWRPPPLGAGETGKADLMADGSILLRVWCRPIKARLREISCVPPPGPLNYEQHAGQAL